MSIGEESRGAEEKSAGSPGGVVLSPRRAAMDLLARREHSRRELADKLRGRFPPDLLDAALDQLRDEGLQSDQRFAESFVRSRAQRGSGPQRIALELRQRGIPPEQVTQAMAAVEIDWHRQLRELSQRRFGTGPAPDARERARRWRFLQQRGFSVEAIRALDESEIPDD